jgi:hypothetical protein
MTRYGTELVAYVTEPMYTGANRITAVLLIESLTQQLGHGNGQMPSALLHPSTMLLYLL